MIKLAQQDSPLLSDTINSEQLIMGIWNKYFADKHKDIVNGLRAEMQKDPNLQIELSKVFPGFTWPEFADMPTNNSLAQLASVVNQLISNKIGWYSSAFEAMHLYMNQYNLLLDQLKGRASKAPAHAKKPNISPKVKQLQQLLGLPQTGSWDAASNMAFLDWLKTNGWDKYISGDRFIGNIDDAIRAMLVEQNSPSKSLDDFGSNSHIDVDGEPSAEDLDSIPQRQSDRLERMKKISNQHDDEQLGDGPLLEAYRANQKNSHAIKGIIHTSEKILIDYLTKTEKYPGLYPDEAKTVAAIAKNAMLEELRKMGYDV